MLNAVAVVSMAAAPSPTAVSTDAQRAGRGARDAGGRVAAQRVPRRQVPRRPAHPPPAEFLFRRLMGEFRRLGPGPRGL